MKKLSVIIPALNEEKIVCMNLKKIGEIFDKLLEKIGFDYEIILVDDGSTDNTYNEAMTMANKNGKIKAFTYEKNGGKGFALKHGFKFCSGELVTFMDVDLDLHPKQIPQFIDYMKKYDADVVIGSKRHPLSKINYPGSRKVLSKGYHTLTRILFHLDLSDTQAGLKLFKYDVLKEILPKVLCKKYAFDLELLVNVGHRGYKIVEAPIELDWQRFESRLTINDIWRLARDTAAIFYRLNILRYYDHVRE